MQQNAEDEESDEPPHPAHRAPSELVPALAFLGHLPLHLSRDLGAGRPRELVLAGVEEILLQIGAFAEVDFLGPRVDRAAHGTREGGRPGAHAHVPVDPAAEGRRARARQHVAPDLGIGAEHEIPAPREQVVRDVPAHGDVAARDADRSAHVPRDDDLPGRGQHVSRHGSPDGHRLSRNHQVAVHGALDVRDLPHDVEVVVQGFRGGQHEVLGVAKGGGSGGCSGEGEEQEHQSQHEPGIARYRSHGRSPRGFTPPSDPRKIVLFASPVQRES